MCACVDVFVQGDACVRMLKACACVYTNQIAARKAELEARRLAEEQDAISCL